MCLGRGWLMGCSVTMHQQNGINPVKWKVTTKKLVPWVFVPKIWGILVWLPKMGPFDSGPHSDVPSGPSSGVSQWATATTECWCDLYIVDLFNCYICYQFVIIKLHWNIDNIIEYHRISNIYIIETSTSFSILAGPGLKNLLTVESHVPSLRWCQRPTTISHSASFWCHFWWAKRSGGRFLY